MGLEIRENSLRAETSPVENSLTAGNSLKVSSLWVESNMGLGVDTIADEGHHECFCAEFLEGGHVEMVHSGKWHPRSLELFSHGHVRVLSHKRGKARLRGA